MRAKLNAIANRVPACEGCGFSKNARLLWTGWTPKKPHPRFLQLFPPPIREGDAANTDSETKSTTTSGQYREAMSL